MVGEMSDKQTLFLKAQGISKSFGGVKALKNVDMQICRGEILCLIGENGSGKSTLIKVLSGVHSPDQGSVWIDGKQYASLTPIDSIKAGIQVIYQDFSLFPNLSVAENIAVSQFLAQGLRLADKKKMADIAKAALEQIQIDINPNASVGELSVAQRQLVAIARTIWQKAKLIIMDEPTTALTAHEVENLFTVVNRLRENGCGILFVSHKLGEVQRIANKIMVLRGGEKVAEGDVAEFDDESMSYYISGKHVQKKQYRFERDVSAEQPVLQVENLRMQSCFEEIGFSLYKGEILGITGLLGSGRTELALSLFGTMQADSGSIFLDGRQQKLRSVQDAIRASMGYLPEDRVTEGLFLDVSIRNNVIVRAVHEEGRFFLQEISLTERAVKLIERLQIKASSIDAPAQSLSGGNQQRVVLAKWLSILPRVLILNGPTVGVDIGSKSDIHEIIRVLAGEGLSIIVISDDIPELMQTCNRILVMNAGRITGQFTTSEIDERVIYGKLK